MSEMPGPEVAVNARAPFHPPPMATPMAASSSSACTMPNSRRPSLVTRRRLACRSKASASEVDGVIGYHAHTVAPA